MLCSIKDSHRMLQQLREQTDSLMQDMQNQMELNSRSESSTLMGAAVFAASADVDTATPGPFSACAGPTMARSAILARSGSVGKLPG